jgi:hypothetical protein
MEGQVDQIRQLLLGIRTMQTQTKRLFDRATKDESLSPALIFLTGRPGV